MSTLTSPQPTRATRKRWTIAEFDDLVTHGFLREGSSTYLWDGEIIEPIPENPPHVNAVANLIELLRGALSRVAWTVDQNAPVELMEGYKPQPDVTVLFGTRADFRGRVPKPSDVALLIEVSSTTYHDDIGGHLQAYVLAGVSAYWIVNVSERQVEIYSLPEVLEPGRAHFVERAIFGLDSSLALELVDRSGGRHPVNISVLDILRDSLATRTS